MVFGPQFYGPHDDWPQMFRGVANAAAVFDFARAQIGGERRLRLAVATRRATDLEAVERFYERAANWSVNVPVAFPRFDDIYGEAGLTSYGTIEDNNGETYQRDVGARAADRTRPVVQIATWNDWGEGTQIEPSREFGMRDLEATQTLRRHKLGSWRISLITPADLQLPLALFRARKSGAPQRQTR